MRCIAALNVTTGDQPVAHKADSKARIGLQAAPRKQLRWKNRSSFGTIAFIDFPWHLCGPADIPTGMTLLTTMSAARGF